MTVEEMIVAEARRQGVPPDIAIAVAQRESSLNPNVRDGAAGEVGLFQVKPSTAADMGVWDLRDLGENIRAGVAYLRWNFTRYGDWSTALMAYNGGPGNVDAGTISSRAATYANEVLASIGWGPSTGEPWSPTPAIALPGSTGTPPTYSATFDTPGSELGLLGVLALGVGLLLLLLD